MTWTLLLADLILVLHFAVVVFVVVGQMLILAGWGLGWHWVCHLGFRLVHLVMVTYIALQAWLGKLCPLTIWEQQLRAKAGQPFYEESFIEHWLSRILFHDLPWWTFVAAYTAFAAVVIASWWWVPPRRSRRG